jgi:hypothetical protein
MKNPISSIGLVLGALLLLAPAGAAPSGPFNLDLPSEPVSDHVSVTRSLAAGFYGVRLIDSVDRWSHGGAENIHIDGLGEQPAFLRGIGGEDTFATAYAARRRHFPVGWR